ncbi:MAG: penicillin-insensitive murein endopeptidase [Gaiellaceae bacterium]
MICRPSPARPPRTPRIVWRPSRAIGSPDAGRLAGAVRLPREGRDFFSWDWVGLRAPNRPGRRWGTAQLVRTILRVSHEYRAAHPPAARVGISDLSRRVGGDFGPRFGKPGHASHQNGLDVDVLYPRLDRRECAVRSWKDIDRPLAQDLVDRFIAAGATLVVVGARTGLTGTPGIVAYTPVYHGEHFHVRLSAP